MAGPLRPVVALIALASAFFLIDGWLDGTYPGGAGWPGGQYYGFGVLSFAFAALNAVVAFLIARGSERTFVARIGLSAFFLVERPATAFLLGPKPPLSLAVHLATAAVELAILVQALRVWHLARAADQEAAVVLSFGRGARTTATRRPSPGGLAPRAAWTLGALAVLLAGLFAADTVAAGFVVGGRPWGITTEASGWLGYVFAVAVVVAAASAIRGNALALRVLFALGLILCLERAFSPLAIRTLDPTALVLHLVGAFVALGLALAAAGAIRARGPGGRRSLAPVQITRV